MADPIRVLLVDDDPDFLDLTAEFLEREDDRLEVASESTARDALDRLADEPVDCVLSDYDMAGMDGREFLEAVRERYGDLPFVLYTGKGSEQVASEAISAGVTDYLQKSPGTDQYSIIANRIHNAVQRHRAQQAVEDSERRLRRIYDRITDGFFAVSPDWRYTYVNDRGARLVERDPDDLLGTRVWDAFPGLVDTAFEDALRSAMETQETTTVEAYYEPHETWYDVRVYPAGDGISIYFRDVTERKNREAERERYERIVEAMGDGVYALDEGGDAIEANEQLAQMTGYDLEALLEGGPALILDDAAIDEFESAITSLIDSEDGTVRTVETTLHRADGDQLPVEVNLTLLPGEGFAGTIGVVRDISQRKERERELEQYETIVETIPDGIFVLDADGRIIQSNEQAASMVGYAMDDVVGEPFSILVEDGVYDDSIIDRYTDHIRELLSSGTTKEQARFEQEALVDGEDRVFETHLALRPYDEEFRGSIGAVRDITERIEYERELTRQNARLENLTSIIAHDLRNPLNVASGYLELARTDVDGDSEPLDRVDSALDRMDELIDDVLTMARVGQTVEETEPVRLSAIVEGCWENVDTPDATYRLADDTTFAADPDRLQHVFENLFRNAVEHGGPDVTIRIGTIDDPAGFYVEDDGPGIDADDPETVLQSGYSTDDDGTGFGLTIVQQMVEAHGWTIAVGEGDSGGARFEITGVESA